MQVLKLFQIDVSSLGQLHLQGGPKNLRGFFSVLQSQQNRIGAERFKGKYFSINAAFSENWLSVESCFKEYL